jgi:hypothetical protein
LQRLCDDQWIIFPTRIICLAILGEALQFVISGARQDFVGQPLQFLKSYVDESWGYRAL